MVDIPNFQQPESQITRKQWLRLAVLVIVITAPILYITTVYSKAHCDTESCFLDRANSCLSTTYTNRLSNLFFLYEIKDGCNLQKSVIAMDSKEPQDIVELFNGRFMVCKYTQGAFKADHLTKITGNLETCEGELKTILSTISI